MSSTPRLTRSTIGTALAVVGSLFIMYVGVSYLLAPQANAAQFGLPSWPHGPDAAFLSVKGLRDLVSGLVILVVLITASRRALGWVLLAAAVTPIGDMLIVLSNDGSVSTALGVHGCTAAAVLLGAVLLLTSPRQDGRPRTT
ncbi:DUF4267 domain-containing protein [Actinocatenispora rupis]|uniref:Small membrane hydrophobic protein n=1 Tax=Actinocatenispora rupis TaxID=519421 RepID=A0A8J3NGC7_9ACTN|nr:DUF4267 domain-containing protein [Actinocatenispora rupis]GID16282.1 hypothetical protein Aru02nite_71710 [Actinocatenispora rupis]